MPRIAGIDLPNDKRIEYALCYIYGVGLTTARSILAEVQVDPSTRARDLTDEETSRIQAVITAKHKVEGDLRRDVSQSIKRLMDIGCYRGLRHRRKLPCRGQNTKNNARTRKGPLSRPGGMKKS